jgi:A/G-specific adenine glycosylase
MLQQTQVITVIPYYQRFLSSFPDLKTLAQASEEKVLAHWAGLGYYSRARNLHRGAQFLLKNHQGRFPRSRDEILKVPGIGPYTAGAVLSIAFDLKEPLVDGNVERVFSRYFALNLPTDSDRKSVV